MNIEPSFYVCGIAHSTWRTFETKYASKPGVDFRSTENKLFQIHIRPLQNISPHQDVNSVRSKIIPAPYP